MLDPDPDSNCWICRLNAELRDMSGNYGGYPSKKLHVFANIFHLCFVVFSLSGLQPTTPLVPSLPGKTMSKRDNFLQQTFYILFRSPDNFHNNKRKRILFPVLSRGHKNNKINSLAMQCRGTHRWSKLYYIILTSTNKGAGRFVWLFLVLKILYYMAKWREKGKMLWIRIRMYLGLPSPDPSLFCTDPDPSLNKQKVWKTLISTILWLLFDFLSIKTDVNVPSKTMRNKLIFCWHLVSHWRQTQYRIWIQIRKSVVQIRGSGSGAKWHGSITKNTYGKYIPYGICTCVSRSVNKAISMFMWLKKLVYLWIEVRILAPRRQYFT